ncbi:MAG TPA: SPOR domain-containing protein [Stellaceae bacterium]|nr:SPOR domain-containing protein [Stellaceae bacterium]
MSYDLGPTEPDQPRERIFGRRRPWRGVMLAVWLLAMAGAAAGIWIVYRDTTRIPVPGEVPLIKADKEPPRKRPTDPGGMAIPDQDKLVYTPSKPEPKTEQLLPPPETPLPRPQAQPAERPAEPPAAIASPPAAPAPDQPTPTVSAPAQAAAASPLVIPKAVPEPPVPPAPPRAAAPPPANPTAAQGGAGYRLQLGSVRTPEGAKHEWEHLKRTNGDVLGALGFAAQRVDLGDRGVFYRIQAGPVADEATAERNCAELKRRSIGCIIVKP